MSKDEKIAIRRPNQRHELGYIQTFTLMTRNVIKSRELIWQLFKRDYFASYKKSFLGPSWVLISPVIAIISWVFLQKAGILKPGNVGIPYPAYVLIGSSMWGLFMGFFTSSSKTLSSISKLALQVNFPHEAIIIKQAAMHVTNFTITLFITILVLLAFGVVPSVWSIFFPLVMLPLFFLGAGIGLIVSMLTVVAVDLNKIINKGVSLLFFITPVIYSVKKIKAGWLVPLVKINPLTYLVCSARDIIIYGKLYHTEGFIICTVISFLFFIVALRLFYIAEDRIIERMLG